MKKIINNKGITLVALVITIVILLILAGISISSLTQTGLFDKANKAKIETRAASVEEQTNLWKLNKESDEALGTSTAKTKEEFLSDLVSQGLLTNNEKETIEKNGKITIGSKTIEFSGQKTLVEMFKNGELQVGDYVNYTPNASATPVTLTTNDTGYTETDEDTNTTQTYTVDTSTTWRILGLSKDGNNLLLTSGSPIKRDGSDPYLILQGAIGYNNCEQVLNKICNMYKNDYANEARSIAVDDINNLLNVNPDNTSLSYTYKIGDYTSNGEKLLEGNTKIGTSIFAKNNYYYSYLDFSDTAVFDILFKDTYDPVYLGNSSNHPKSYWLATQIIKEDSYSTDGFSFCVGTVDRGEVNGWNPYSLLRTIGYYTASEFAVRPIISLKSNVTSNEIQKIDGPVEGETIWNTDPGMKNQGKLKN